MVDKPTWFEIDATSEFDRGIEAFFYALFDLG